MAALARLWPFLAAWFRKWGVALLAFLAGQFTKWFESLKEWVSEELQDFFIKGNQDAEDLRDFVALMRGKSSKFEDKIQKRLDDTKGTLREKRDAAMKRFDEVSDRMHAKHPVLWNDSYRSQLRTKLSDAMEKAEITFVERMERESRRTVALGQKVVADAIAGATNAFQKAEVKRAEVAALRSPKFVGRSDTQVAGYLKALKAGTGAGHYTQEELDNEISGRKKQGKWNPH